MKTPQDKILSGECISPFTTERCPYCTDTCKARESRKIIEDIKRQASICKVHIAKEDGVILLLKDKGSDLGGYVDVRTNNN